MLLMLLMLLRCIRCECLFASVWVPSGGGSSGLLHGDGDDVARKRIAREGGEAKHPLSASTVTLCFFSLSRDFPIR